MGQLPFRSFALTLKAGSEIPLPSLFPGPVTCRDLGCPEGLIPGPGWDAADHELCQEPCEGDLGGRNGDHLSACPCLPPCGLGVPGLQMQAPRGWDGPSTCGEGQEPSVRPTRNPHEIENSDPTSCWEDNGLPGSQLPPGAVTSSGAGPGLMFQKFLPQGLALRRLRWVKGPRCAR